MPTYPLPRHADGRKASISDGYHSAAEWRAWQLYDASLKSGKPIPRPLFARPPRQHRGADLMYWIPRLSPARGKPAHPYSTGGYEIPRPLIHGGYDVPVLAMQTGRVAAAGRLPTGCWVALDLGCGVGVAYHHLSRVLVQPGPHVGEGTPLGYVGGSPVGYGLWHLHLDYATECRWEISRLARLERLDGTFHDPAGVLALCRHVTLEQSWGAAGRT